MRLGVAAQAQLDLITSRVLHTRKGQPERTMEHNHTPEEERRIRDAALDHTLEESFPASDPSSTLPNPDNDDVLNDHSIAPPPGEVRNED
jgi:hypothetical protein